MNTASSLTQFSMVMVSVTLGVELEIDIVGHDSKNTEQILDIGNYSDDHIYIKSDGSLNDGMEIVTHPMTLDYHLNEFCWEDILHECIRFYTFVENHWDSMLKFSIHRESTMNRWATRYGYESTPKEILDKAKKSYGRYFAIII